MKKLFENIKNIINHFVLRLRETPLLTGWLVIGTGAAFIVRGWSGVLLALINLVLLGFYAVLIRWMTPQVPGKTALKRPALELAAGLVLLALIIVVQLFHFGVWTAQPCYGWIKNFFAGIYVAIMNAGFIPEWALQDVFLAASSTVKQLIPTLMALTLMGYFRPKFRQSVSCVKLTAVLVGITVFFGLVNGMFYQQPPLQIAVIWLLGILINALPEEHLFRGFLLTRLEKLFTNPLNALVISAMLFNAIHLPIEIYHGTPAIKAFISIFSTAYPSGLIWGYLYLRTRSIVPGLFWHATNNIGFTFLDF